ncbi:MAG: hypothetical protein II896_07810 [Clostridia bacterium]|nr:hypothetical protein [Clostridia bacterium]
MSKVKSRTPCFVAGCLVVAVIFIVVVVMLGVLFLHIPASKSFSERMGRDGKLNAVHIEGEYGLDLAQLSDQSRNIYQTLQSEYQVAGAKSSADEEGGSTLGAPFKCNAIVEYYSKAEEEGSKNYVYGMLIYTDSIKTAYDVFTTYYRIANEQGTDFSQTEYFLFVRGNAVFVGNNRAFLKAYMNNLF